MKLKAQLVLDFFLDIIYHNDVKVSQFKVWHIVHANKMKFTNIKVFPLQLKQTLSQILRKYQTGKKFDENFLILVQNSKTILKKIEMHACQCVSCKWALAYFVTIFDVTISVTNIQLSVTSVCDISENIQFL